MQSNARTVGYGELKFGLDRALEEDMANPLSELTAADLDDIVGGLNWSKIGNEAKTHAVGYGAIGGVAGGGIGAVMGGPAGAAVGAGVGAAGGAVGGGALGAGREFVKQMGWQVQGSGYE